MINLNCGIMTINKRNNIKMTDMLGYVQGLGEGKIIYMRMKKLK